MEERPKSRLSAGAACFPGEHPSTPRAAPPVPDEDHSDGTSTPPTSSVSSREHPILQKKENTIFVGGLPPAADVEDLRQYFRVFGPLTVVRVRVLALARPGETAVADTPSVPSSSETLRPAAPSATPL